MAYIASRKLSVCEFCSPGGSGKSVIVLWPLGFHRFAQGGGKAKAVKP